MNRGTKNLLTCWCPIGPVGLDEGTLYILEDSHNWNDIREQFEGLDVDRDKNSVGHIKDTPLWLTKGSLWHDIRNIFSWNCRGAQIWT